MERPRHAPTPEPPLPLDGLACCTDARRALLVRLASVVAEPSLPSRATAAHAFEAPEAQRERTTVGVVQTLPVICAHDPLTIRSGTLSERLSQSTRFEKWFRRESSTQKYSTNGIEEKGVYV